MDKICAIPKIQLELGIPSNESEVAERLSLLKSINHKSYDLISSSVTNKKIDSKSFKKIFKENKIDNLDKLTMLILYCSQIEDIYGLFETFPIDKKLISNIIYGYHLPTIRAKFAALEILAAADSGSVVFRYLIQTCDLYIRSELFLDLLAQTRRLKYSAEQDSDKLIKILFKLLDTDSRGKKQKSQNFYWNRFLKNMIETGISLLRKSLIAESQFLNTLKDFNITADIILIQQIYGRNMGASELALEMMTNSKVISSPTAYWDQTKSNGSTNLNNWISYLFVEKITKDIMMDPILRSHKIWKPLESFENLPRAWSQNPTLDSITQDYFLVFFKRQNEDAHTTPKF